MFTPFAYYKNPFTWTPEDFSGILYHFISDFGITLDGAGRVEQWTDTLGTTTLVDNAGSTESLQYNSSNSNINNKPSLFNDGTDESIAVRPIPSPTTNTDDITVIWIGLPTATGLNSPVVSAGLGYADPYVSGGPFILMPWISYTGYTDEFGVTFSSAGTSLAISSGVSVNSGALTWNAVSYDSSAGEVTQWINSSTPAVTTTGLPTDVLRTWNMEVGAYDFTDYKYQGDIMEFIVIKGIPTTEELDNLNTYVNIRYGG